MWWPLSIVAPRTSSAHVAPDRDRVAPQLLEVVVDRPGDQRRASHPAAGRAVGVVVRAVDAEAGAVVLAHRVDRLRVVDRAAVVGERLLPHDLRPGAVPGVRVGADHALGGLRRSARGRTSATTRAANRASARASASPIGIESSTASAVTASGMVHRRPERDVAAAIVPGDREPLVPERAPSAPRSRAPSRAWSTARGPPWSAASRTRRSRAGPGTRR